MANQPRLPDRADYIVLGGAVTLMLAAVPIVRWSVEFMFQLLS